MTIQRMTSHFPRTAWRLLVLACVLPLLFACDDESLNQPDTADDRFDRYVALGNSITAGFQADGINTDLQQDSYAVLLAGQMGTRFEIPALQRPGCPPPLTNIFTQERLGDTTRETCALRSSPIPTDLNNVSVPGATIANATTNDPSQGAATSPLTTFILGGRTQAEVAAEVDPTFASVWLGNNDVLGAALAGNTALITPQDRFESQYTAALDELEAAGADAGVLIGVANVAFIPNLSPGPAYLAAETQINQFGQQQSPAWGNFDVANSCAPGASGETTRVPFSYGFGQLFQQALQGANVVLDCDPATAADPLLTGPELAEIQQAVTDFNAFIQQQADDRGWAYVDVNPALGALYAAGTDTPNDPSDDLVPKFPIPPSPDTPNPDSFGEFFSLDGVHPSAPTHRVVTNFVIEAINAEYGTSLQTIDAPQIPAPPQ